MNPTTHDSISTVDPGPVGVAPKVIPHSVRVTTNNDSSRCPYRFSNGKRCRLPALASQFGLISA